MARILYRLGVASARHRRWTFAAWGLTLLVAAVVTLTGMRFSDGAFEIPGTESSEAMSTVQDAFGATTPSTLQLVVQAPDGATVTDPAVADRITSAREELAESNRVTDVSDPLDQQSPFVSPDLSTAVVTITYADDLSEQAADAAHTAVVRVADDLRETGLTAEVGGSLANPVPEILGPSEIVGALLAFGVLILTFGSLAAAGANMAGALVGVGVGILGILAASAVRPIGTITPILAVMLGLAVGIDYCLFVLARFRSELAAGHDVHHAIGRATGTAGSAVVFAGMTVIIALVGLSVVGIPFITEMGVAAAFAVLIAVLMAVTLLPALAATIGHRALPRTVRRLTETPEATRSRRTERTGFLTRWIEAVMRRPVIAVISAVAALLVVAAPVTSLRTALDTPGGEDPASTQRAAYQLVADAFGAGAQSPLIVLVTGDGAAERAADVAARIGSVDDVAAAMVAQTSDDGNAAMITVIADTGPLDSATEDLVHAIRDLPTTPGTDLRVTGSTAIGLDTDAQLSQALVTYLILIVGLSLVLLIILFRSLLVPVVATLGFLLSLGAGLGATVAVFQWGWLDPVIQAPQGNPLLSLLPILVTGILFGLAMDYQVFLVSRIHEAHAAGADPRAAIRLGFGRAAVVVAAAAGIMAAVFGGFALSHSSLVGSIALALAVGVLADAFVVRMIIVPAALTLLGRSAWWMPSWLRWLPSVDAEGHGLDRHPTSSDEREPALVP